MYTTPLGIELPACSINSLRTTIVTDEVYPMVILNHLLDLRDDKTVILKYNSADVFTVSFGEANNAPLIAVLPISSNANT